MPDHGGQSRRRAGADPRAAASLVPQHLVVGTRPGRGPSCGPSAADTVHTDAPHLGERWWYRRTGDAAELLFTENETNSERLCGRAEPTPYVKDGYQRRRRRRPGERGEPSAGGQQGRGALSGHGRRRARASRCACGSRPTGDGRPFGDFDASLCTAHPRGRRVLRGRRTVQAERTTSARCSDRRLPGCCGRSSSTTTTSIAGWTAIPASPPPPEERNAGATPTGQHLYNAGRDLHARQMGVSLVSPPGIWRFTACRWP